MEVSQKNIMSKLDFYSIPKNLELSVSVQKHQTFSMHHDKGWQVHKAKVGKSQFIAICLQSFVEVSPPCHCGPDWRWRGTIGVLTS